MSSTRGWPLAALACAWLIVLASGARAGAARSLIVLLTDYGTKDFYVGALKGAIYRVLPTAAIDSITHDVPDFDIQEGAYTLLQAARDFPEGTIFLALVDPGVGTPRKSLLVHTRNDLYFVAPDNGILTLVVDEFGLDWAREIANPKVMRPGKVSKTFSGRDLFAPAAAHLARGVTPAEFGPAVKALARLPVTPLSVDHGRISGCVLMADHYGNLITNITGDALSRGGLAVGASLRVDIGERSIVLPLTQTYADVPQGKPLALVASSGYVELAVNLGSMAGFTGAARNTPVRLERAP